MLKLSDTYCWGLPYGRITINNCFGAPFGGYDCGWSNFMGKMMMYQTIGGIFSNAFSSLINAFRPGAAQAQQQTPMQYAQTFYPYLNISRPYYMLGYGGVEGRGGYLGGYQDRYISANNEDQSELRELQNMYADLYKIGKIGDKYVARDQYGKQIKADSLSELTDKIGEACDANGSRKAKKDKAEDEPDVDDTPKPEEKGTAKPEEKGTVKPEEEGEAPKVEGAGDAGKAAGAGDAGKAAGAGNSGKANATKYKKGTAPDGYVWTKYSKLNDDSKKKFTKDMSIDDILKAIPCDVNDKNKQLLRDANPTAIVNDKLANPEKLDLFIKGSNGNSSSGNNNSNYTISGTGKEKNGGYEITATYKDSQGNQKSITVNGNDKNAAISMLQIRLNSISDIPDGAKINIKFT